MGWVVITSGDRWQATVYRTEEEAERAAREFVMDSDEEVWVAIADQSTKKTRMISLGEDD